jgi:LysR family glycine cleavage system transcriptional activator
MVEEERRDLLAGLGRHPGRRIPSLNALRAFESVARLRTCTRAAEELHVTPAAVSQQIRYLEDLAGTPLFLRVNRAFVLTDAGRRCLPEVRKGFAHLAGAMQQIREAGRREHIAVCVSPAFAVRWLLPRLSGFTGAHLDADVWLSTSLLPIHLTESRVDVAVTYGTGDFFGQAAELLVPVTDVAVCTPAVYGRHPIRAPGDLRAHTLIHESPEIDDPAVPCWADWLRAHGIDGIDAERGPRFSNPGLVIEAALAGLGVALARSALVASELRAGTLVQLFAVDAGGRTGYYLLRNPGCAAPQVADAFCDWLRAGIAADAPPAPSR